MFWVVIVTVVLGLLVWLAEEWRDWVRERKMNCHEGDCGDDLRRIQAERDMGFDLLWRLQGERWYHPEATIGKVAFVNDIGHCVEIRFEVQVLAEDFERDSLLRVVRDSVSDRAYLDTETRLIVAPSPRVILGEVRAEGFRAPLHSFVSDRREFFFEALYRKRDEKDSHPVRTH